MLERTITKSIGFYMYSLSKILGDTTKRDGSRLRKCWLLSGAKWVADMMEQQPARCPPRSIPGVARSKAAAVARKIGSSKAVSGGNYDKTVVHSQFSRIDCECHGPRFICRLSGCSARQHSTMPSNLTSDTNIIERKKKLFKHPLLLCPLFCLDLRRGVRR